MEETREQINEMMFKNSVSQFGGPRPFNWDCKAWDDLFVAIFPKGWFFKIMSSLLCALVVSKVPWGKLS